MDDKSYQTALLDELLKYDIGRSAYFEVQIGPVNATSFNNMSSLRYLCHSAELPGESTATVSQKIYGVVEKYPIMSAYNDITLSFYTRGSDKDITRYNFLTWLASITGRNEIVNSKESNSTSYNVKYKDDITARIDIIHYSATGKELTRCTLMDAFPLGISEAPLAWSASNQAISLNVTFAYTEYMYNYDTFSTTALNNSITRAFSNGNTLTNAISGAITPTFSFSTPTIPQTLIP